MRLNQQVAVVTGGARGIGRCICETLGGEGAALAIVDILLETAEATAAELREKGMNAKAFACDVASGDDAKRVVKAILDHFGRLDILVNNAGITRDGLLMRMKEADWDLVLRVNLTGTFNMTKAVVRPMMKARRGRIVNIASVVGVMGNAGQANYSASKAGVIGLTKSCAKEFASRGIRVNAVAPGYIATDMTDKLTDEARDAFLTAIPLGRPGTPEDVAGVVAFLAGPASAYVTGQTINIDGGMVM